jgi:hypothetical protein
MLTNRRCRTQASALHFRVGIAMLSCTKNWPICNWIYNVMNKIDNTFGTWGNFVCLSRTIQAMSSGKSLKFASLHALENTILNLY